MKLPDWCYFDWKTVDVLHGYWTEKEGGLPWSVCAYEIMFSKSKHKYKLKPSGHKCKYHPQYKAALLALKKYNESLSNKTTTR